MIKEQGPSLLIDLIGGFDISAPKIGVLPFFFEGLTQYFSKTLSVSHLRRDCSSEALRTPDSETLWYSLSESKAESWRVGRVGSVWPSLNLVGRLSSTGSGGGRGGALET